jgi:MarR-like DNA-binding transcriptional regulator SgrR of sgrS sRNA
MSYSTKAPTKSEVIQWATDHMHHMKAEEAKAKKEEAAKKMATAEKTLAVTEEKLLQLAQEKVELKAQESQAKAKIAQSTAKIAQLTADEEVIKAKLASVKKVATTAPQVLPKKTASSTVTENLDAKKGVTTTTPSTTSSFTQQEKALITGFSIAFGIPKTIAEDVQQTIYQTFIKDSITLGNKVLVLQRPATIINYLDNNPSVTSLSLNLFTFKDETATKEFLVSLATHIEKTKIVKSVVFSKSIQENFSAEFASIKTKGAAVSFK